ncbi:MAG TPA: hypothetical protein VH187_01440 [Scandinavium sp.]|jgi:hypothetical protein|uniref:hypothetical protein n=1 Tax=Scandinavium sp. TaxID=2830653 RepID=UPI002E365400|nr:hypothetical protein [Scandinavium sp.]HEX4499821.1 hypothetical protein [Scandinavium sp.]
MKYRIRVHQVPPDAPSTTSWFTLDGVVREFASESEAQIEAQRLTRDAQSLDVWYIAVAVPDG